MANLKLSNEYPIKNVQVISRIDIPAINEIFVKEKKYNLGTHQDFRRNKELAQFIPEYGRISLSWTSLRLNKVLEKHQHPNKSMVLVIKGSGSLIGNLTTKIYEGDAVLIPEDCTHGFIADNGEDLYALSIQFDDGLYENIENPKVSFLPKENGNLQKLLYLNKTRLAAHITTGFFELLTDGTLKNDQKKRVFFNCLYFWSNHFQKLLHVRQGIVSNKNLSYMYLQHFKEEFGHDELLKNERNITDEDIGVDIEAYASWFLIKTLTGSDFEKIVMIHLVLETSAHAFHEIAAQSLNEGSKNETYFDIHKEADEDHSMLGRELLENLPNETYVELEEFLNKCWNMLDAMLAQMNTLIRA